MPAFDSFLLILPKLSSLSLPMAVGSKSGEDRVNSADCCTDKVTPFGGEIVRVWGVIIAGNLNEERY